MYGYTTAPFGTLLWLVFWAVIIAIIVRLVRGNSMRHNVVEEWFEDKSDHHEPPKDFREKTAMDILDERYALGEIDKLEYDQKKNDIIRKTIV